MPKSLSNQKRIDSTLAISLVLLLWLAYTTLQTLFVLGFANEAWSAVLGFVPGFLGVGILLLAGSSFQDCFLRFSRLSWSGFAVLAGIFIFAMAAVLPFSAWVGWSWTAALIYAPASGISQELFFRSSLLPAMRTTFPKRPSLALVLHSAFFGLWHIGPLFLGAPLWAVLAVMFVPFVSGIGWGWQVERDGTVAWAMLQHSLFWVIGLQFTMVG
jgi:membrane protease YdiL (CAAX protease family)